MKQNETIHIFLICQITYWKISWWIKPAMIPTPIPPKKLSLFGSDVHKQLYLVLFNIVDKGIERYIRLHRHGNAEPFFGPDDALLKISKVYFIINYSLKSYICTMNVLLTVPSMMFLQAHLTKQYSLIKVCQQELAIRETY